MARVRQFANDMGMSYNQAKNLVNKGRKLKDGGSSVLESTMNKVKPVMASNGKSLSKAEMAKYLEKRGLSKKGLERQKKVKGQGQSSSDFIGRLTRVRTGSGANPIADKEFMLTGKDGDPIVKKSPDSLTNRKKKLMDKVKSLESEANRVKNIMKKAMGGAFPDLSGDGKVTQKDILIGRGVIDKPEKKAKKGAMIKMRDGGQFRGCGAQIKGKKFKGIF